MSELRNSVLKENRRTDGRHFATVWTGLIRGRPNQSILASLSLNPTIPVADKFMKSWPARWTSWLIQKDEGQPGKPKFSVSHSHYFLPQQHLHGRLGSWERIQVSKNQCQAFRQKQAAGNLSGKSLKLSEWKSNHHTHIIGAKKFYFRSRWIEVWRC